MSFKGAHALRGELIEYASREDWFADARNEAPHFSVGGTTAAAILGVGYRTPWDVYLSAHGLQPRELDAGDDSAVLKRGRRWEPIALEDYAERTGRRTHSPLCRVEHPLAPWLRPSPDAFVEDDELGLGVGEVKTASWGDAWGDDGTVIERWTEGSELLVPPGYAVQGYITLDATGLPFLDFIVGTPDRVQFMQIRVVRMLRDPDTQEALVQQVASWRRAHLLEGEAPPPDATDSCRKGLFARFPGRGDKQITQATDSQAELIGQLADAKKRLAQAEADEQLAANTLMASIGDGYGVVAGTSKALVIRAAGQRYLDQKGLAAAHPDLVAQFQKSKAPYAYVRLFGGKE